MKRSKSFFKTLKEEKIFQNKIFSLKRITKQAPSGKKFQHDIVCHGGSVVIVPKDSEGCFYLIHQYRTAANGFLWEFPAGTIEHGETARQCAARELMEESGWRAGSLRRLTGFYLAPGISTEYMHLYLAQKLEPVEAVSEPDEFIEVRRFSERDLIGMIGRGQIQDAKTLLGFFLYLAGKSEK